MITPIVSPNPDAFWFLAYNLIWNQFFRDENLQDSVYFNKGDGPHAASNFTLLRRGKRHDYFTSCLPWPQKGPAVDLPLTGNAPVLGIGMRTQVYGTAAPTVWETGGTSSTSYASGRPTSDINAAIIKEDPSNPGYPGVYADMQNVSGVTINQFRQAFQIQMLLENDARGGTRYVEILRAHFGVISPDFRLQRPEYLGGGSTPITVTPIPRLHLLMIRPLRAIWLRMELLSLRMVIPSPLLSTELCSVLLLFVLILPINLGCVVCGPVRRVMIFTGPHLPILVNRLF